MKRVERLKPGTIINYAKEKFVVLGERNGGVFCLLAQSKDDVEFYDGNEKPYNDYRKSKLRATVEGRFLTRLFENGASMDDLVPYDLDLSETDGSDGYGVLQNVLAAPLTLWDYGKYKGVIPNNEDGAWWLATPLWAPRSPDTYNSYVVWRVGSDGGYATTGTTAPASCAPLLFSTLRSWSLMRVRKKKSTWRECQTNCSWKKSNADGRKECSPLALRGLSSRLRESKDGDCKNQGHNFRTGLVH